MSAMNSEAPSIASNDLRAFPKPVRDILMEAINQYQVSYRLQDGSHIRLYNGDRDVIPLKVSASRAEQHTLRYLLPWLDEHCEAWANREKVEVADVERLKVVLDTTPAPEPQAVEPEATDEVEWVDAGHGFVTDGEIYRCTECGYLKTDNARGLHLHQRGTHPTPEQAKEWAAATKKGGSTRAMLAAQRKAHLEQAVTVLAEHYGIIGTADQKVAEKALAKANAEIANLNDQVAKLKQELDDTKARLSLVREAMKA